ncbi:MAG: sulfatase-like hydrolase/transferase [Kiritimatiellaeota bacterium]|nr:sulfatase-like hydrolase/transferase [Kiritimatiellota bacterium]
MNIIVIMNDTLRPDHLSAYGNDWCRTPNFGSFARTATVFDNCYAGSFPTIPNRTDLFTGRYGEPLHPWLPLSFNEITLPEIMRENGYVTQLICDTPHLINGGHNFDWPFHAWDFIRGNEVDRYGMDSDPVDLPFKDFSKINRKTVNKSLVQNRRNNRGRRTERDWVTYKTFDRAVDWLERNLGHEKFFLWIDGFDPHEPTEAPRHYVDLYDPGYTGDQFLSHIPDPSKLTAAEIHNIKARYAACVTFVDRCVGMVLEAVDRLGLTDNTCVVCLSDHGTHLNEHGALLSKNCMFTEVARTVHMIRIPGVTHGTHCPALVQPADLAPTLLELVGIEIPAVMQGTSYLPILQGKPGTIRDVAITGAAPNARTDKAVIIARDQRWQLRDSPIPAQRVLHDLEDDPLQTTNVADDNPEVVARLHAAVIDFLKKHEAQPQIIRWFETGDKGDMSGYVARRPGCERFHAYFSHILDSGMIPNEAS